MDRDHPAGGRGGSRSTSKLDYDEVYRKSGIRSIVKSIANK